MAAVRLHRMLHHVRTLVVTGPLDDLSDGQLLERFAADGNASAFETLVRRHGRLVLGVCRRVLGAGPDLDDVFQATFLVLARKAASIRKQAAVASWLYGVAFRLARHLQAQRVRREKRHQPVELLEQIPEARTVQVDPITRASVRELAVLLDEELQRLPGKYREALVLCHLEGLSVAEAAAQLGAALGTFKSRLLRGRDLLRSRLTRRGVTLSAASLAVVLAEQTACAALPTHLLRTAVAGGLAYAARPLPSAAVSAQAAALAEGAAGTVALAKLPLAVVALLLTGLLCLAASWLPGQAPGAAPKSPTLETPVVGAPQPVPEDVLGDPLPPGAITRLGTLRWRHGVPVHFVAVGPDGKTVVSASLDGVVHIWDSASGKELHRLAVSAKRLKAELGTAGLLAMSRRPLFSVVAVSPDGKLLATGFDERAAHLWQIADGKKLATIPFGNETEAGALAFAPDGKHLALADARGLIQLWDLQAGKFVRTFENNADRRSLFVLGTKRGMLLYGGGGKLLACAVIDGQGAPLAVKFQFWDANTGKQLHAIETPNTARPYSPVFSPDGKLFAFGTSEGEVSLHQALDGKLLHKWTLAGKRESPLVAFAADSARLYTKTVGDRAVREWDVQTGKPLRWLADTDHDKTVNVPVTQVMGCLTLTADGKTLAVGGDGNGLRFLDLATGKTLTMPNGHDAPVTSLSYMLDGKSLLTHAGDSTVRKWEASTGKQLKQFAVPAKTLRHAVTPDGRVLAVLDDKHVLTLIDTDSGKELARIGEPASNPPTFFFAPDGRTLLVRRLDETSIALYDVPSGKERCRVGHSIVNAVEAARGQMIDTSSTMFFSPDSRRLGVFAAPKAAAIFDTATGLLIQKFPLADKVGIRSGAFSPDGRTLALESHLGVISIVELAVGKERLSLDKLPVKVPKAANIGGGGGGTMGGPLFGPAGTTTLAFSPDSRLLAHGGRQPMLTVWDTATGKALTKCEGHQAYLSSVAFAPDGRSVATGSGDCTVLVWDVQGLSAKAGPVPGVLDADAIKVRWDALAADDAVAALDAINALVVAPKQSVPFLKTQLRPEAVVAGATIVQLIEQLDSGEFKVRSKAKTELLSAGDQALPYVEKELARKIPLEVRRILVDMQAKLAMGSMTGERLRLFRAIEVLERIGNAEARQVLQMLAAGAPGQLGTTQAQAAIKRQGK
jgi:RNA polymerase sigma factor (sigma-70 family)